MLSGNDLDWYAARLAIAVYETQRLNPEMAMWELKQAFPGLQTISTAPNGNQIFHFPDRDLEVGPMASNDEIAAALANPWIRTENTRMSVTGAKFLAEQIRNQLASTKAQLAQAGNEMSAAMTELQATADEATKQVKEVQAETADLKAALGLSSNGGPT